jgi:hypothetical protein
LSVFSVGRWLVHVDPWLLELVAARCDVGAWGAPDTRSELELRCGVGPRPSGTVPLDTQSPEAGGYLFQGRTLDVWIPPVALAADAALRLLFATSFELQGGMLLHAAGIGLEDNALLALGVSGAGKSTLAQHCAEARLEILSDETIGLLADGTVWPTPFRSSARYAVDRPKAPRALRAVTFLEHAREERLAPLKGVDAAARLLRQIYPGPALEARERLRRAVALASFCPPVSFGLRHHPEVAVFVREALSRQPPALSGSGAPAPSG